MKHITRRAVTAYMAVFVPLALEHGRRTIRMNADSIIALSRRRDFPAALRLLEAAGYIEPVGDVFPPVALRLTDRGLTYFIESRARFLENLWTRGLSIAAIVVSIIALVLG